MQLCNARVVEDAHPPPAYLVAPGPERWAMFAPQLADDAFTLVAAASLVTRQADIRVPDPGWFAPLRLLADEAVNRAMQAVRVRLHGWRAPEEPTPEWG